MTDAQASMPDHIIMFTTEAIEGQYIELVMKMPRLKAPTSKASRKVLDNGGLYLLNSVYETGE